MRNYYFTQYGITWHEILTVPAFNESLVDVLKMIHYLKNLLFFIHFLKMPLVTIIKAVCYAVLITLIITTGLNIFNTLNALQLERIEQINKALK